MKYIFLFACATFLAPAATRADSSDDTLKFYLKKSDLVVLGTIKSDLIGVSEEVGVLNYVCEFKVAEVLKGDPELKSKTIHVNIMRFELDPKDKHPLIRKDADCILFLKQEGEGTIPNWITTDFWFGIQQPSPSMAKSLKRLAAE